MLKKDQQPSVEMEECKGERELAGELQSIGSDSKPESL